MLVYYTGVTLLVCLSLVVAIALVAENGRMSRREKTRFYGTYIVIILAAVCEAFSILLNGAPLGTMMIHRVVKGLDYCFSPLAAYYMVKLTDPSVKVERLLAILMGMNVILQALSMFTGWTFYLDAENYYHHGQAYILYIVIYVIVIFICLYSYFRYGKKYRKENRLSLGLIIFLVFLGIILHEVFSEMRVTNLALGLGTILMFIHYSEFRLQDSDDYMRWQKEMLRKDAMTGLYSRYSYYEEMNEYADGKELSDDFVIFSIDLNGLKGVNDRHGHEAGDELIRGAAECINEVLKPYGKCYRIGGDEFIAFIHTKEDPEKLADRLREKAGQWKGTFVSGQSFSIGIIRAKDNPGIRIEDLVVLADWRMYADKEAFYKRKENDRRK